MFFVTLLLIVAASNAELPKFLCQLTKEGTACKVAGIDSNQFQIETSEPYKVTEMEITDSSIHVWDNEICETFPNLTDLSAEFNKIASIEPGVFRRCSKLKKLDFDVNDLRELKLGTFQGLVRLEKLYLLTNKLMYLQPELLADLPALENLQLGKNNLFEFDEVNVKKFAKMSLILNLEDNNIRCDRIFPISRAIPFVKLNITKRLRNYIPNSANGIVCLSNEQWLGEFSSVVPRKDVLSYITQTYFVQSKFEPLIDALLAGNSTEVDFGGQKNPVPAHVGVNYWLLAFFCLASVVLGSFLTFYLLSRGLKNHSEVRVSFDNLLHSCQNA